MFSITDYLENREWDEKHENFFKKGFKTIKIIGEQRLMIAMNFDKKVKHKHIVTCRIPQNENDADVIFSLCNID